MATERRTDEQIRAEIATERAGLLDALRDLRASARAKRKGATVVAGGVATAAAATAALKIARRLRGHSS